MNLVDPGVSLRHVSEVLNRGAADDSRWQGAESLEMVVPSISLRQAAGATVLNRLATACGRLEGASSKKLIVPDVSQWQGPDTASRRIV